MGFSFLICVPLAKLPGSPAAICLMGNYSVALEVCVGGGAAQGLDGPSCFCLVQFISPIFCLQLQLLVRVLESCCLGQLVVANAFSPSL